MSKTMDLNLRKFFCATDFACQCGNVACKRTAEKIDALPFFGLDERIGGALYEVRCDVAMPLGISSGWRCREYHPIAKAKRRPGAHSAGYAVDVYPYTPTATKHGVLLAAVFLRFGWRGQIKGVGVADTFVHIDCDHPSLTRPAEGVRWVYPKQ